MLKLWKIILSRKGVNDVSIMSGIILLFILMGVLLPYISNDLNDSQTIYNTDDIGSNIDNETNLTSITALVLIKSVASMFFWTFGTLPFWLDAIFLSIRITLGILIYRQVRSGGG